MGGRGEEGRGGLAADSPAPPSGILPLPGSHPRAGVDFLARGQPSLASPCGYQGCGYDFFCRGRSAGPHHCSWGGPNKTGVLTRRPRGLGQQLPAHLKATERKFSLGESGRSGWCMQGSWVELWSVALPRTAGGLGGLGGLGDRDGSPGRPRPHGEVAPPLRTGFLPGQRK